MSCKNCNCNECQLDRYRNSEYDVVFKPCVFCGNSLIRKINGRTVSMTCELCGKDDPKQ